MALIMFAVTLALAQSPPVPSRPDAAVIEGYIVKTGTSEPIARARVALVRDGGPPVNVTATTDGSGKYILQDIAPGRYRLTVTRDGYVRAEYGQRGPGRPGSVITLGPRQEARDVVIGMTPTGAIAGRVFDRYGDPLANASVQALKYVFQDGRRVLSTVQSARTNDLGEYRLFWLQPGSYIISAVPSELPRLELPGGGAVEVERAVSDVQITRGPGVRIGGPGAFVSGLQAAGPGSPDMNEAFLPVYYRGTTEAAGAAPIELQPGANFTGVDLTVAETRALKVRGRVINGVNGQVGGVNVTLVPRGTTIGALQSQRSATTSDSGEFEIRGVAPGAYDLVANYGSQIMVTFGPEGTEVRAFAFSSAAPGPGAGGLPPRGRSPADLAREPRLAARLPLDVGNADIDGVNVSLQAGFNLTGRITVESSPAGGAGETPRAQSIRFQLRPDPVIPQLTPLPGPTNADGTFTVNSVIPGDYRASLGGVPRNAYVKSAKLGEMDILNSVVTLDGAPRGSVEVVIGTNPGSADFTVVDDKQAPVAGVTVVLIPEVSRRGRSDLYRTATTDLSGRVRLDGIAPGEYKLFAWDDVESGVWLDPEFMRAQEARGRSIRIGEGGRESAELKLLKVRQ